MATSSGLAHRLNTVCAASAFQISGRALSASTKAEALKKLAALTVKVGYPDKPRDYSDVVIRDDDLVGDVRRAAAADWAAGKSLHDSHLEETVSSELVSEAGSCRRPGDPGGPGAIK